jgi:hypothetical protein
VHRDGVRGNLQRVRKEQVPLSHEHLGYKQEIFNFYMNRYEDTKNIMFIVIVYYCSLIPTCA